jgi:hypothetical protein
LDRASYWNTFIRNRVGTEGGREKETCDACAETAAASIVNIANLLPPNRIIAIAMRAREAAASRGRTPRS